MTSQVSGNTNPSTSEVSFRARAFLLTLNEVDKYPLLKSLITKLKSCDYYLAAIEQAPTTGHQHIHIYIHLKGRARSCLSRVSYYLPLLGRKGFLKGRKSKC